MACTCRIEAWIFLNRSIEATFDTNVVSFGRFSLQIRAPSGAPALLVRPNASVLVDQYVVTDKIRGYCGNMGIGSAKMATVVEAAAFCSKTPGAHGTRLRLWLTHSARLECPTAMLALWLSSVLQLRSLS